MLIVSRKCFIAFHVSGVALRQAEATEGLREYFEHIVHAVP